MHYAKLNLGINPVRYNFELEINEGKDFWHCYPNVQSVLDDWVLEKFEELELDPCLIVIFASPLIERTHGYLHKDLIWKDERWQTVPCSVNWELSPVATNIKWYDTSKCKEFWPNTDEIVYPYNYLNAVDFGNQSSCMSLLEETIIDFASPILFRTDVAHILTYKSQIDRRFMCSVRFNNINSWENALEKFKNLIVY